MYVFLVMCIIGAVRGTDIYETEPGNLQPLFASLKYHGLLELNQTLSEHPGLELKQYLVAAVLTEDEFKRASSWSSDDLLVLEEENRTQTYVNESRSGDMPFYGEETFLYDDGGLNDMVTAVREKSGHDTVPYIVMYSYYVPCTFVTNVKFNCYDSLADEATRRRYPMFIAFTELFEITPPQDLLVTYMAIANIRSFEASSQYMNLVYTPRDFVGVGGTFQTLYSNCLTDMGITYCEGSGVEDAVKARFVNTLVYSCTKNSSSKGVLDRYNRGDLFNCLTVNTKNCHVCNKCPENDVLGYVFQLCATSILRQDVAFGFARNLDDSAWEPFEGPWSHVIRSVDTNLLQRLPCNVRWNALSECWSTLEKSVRNARVSDKREGVHQKIAMYFLEAERIRNSNQRAP